MNTLDEYKLCSICNLPLSEGLAHLAVRNFERKICGAAKCKKTYDVKYNRICCEKAEYTNCVCTRSYKCPEHGEVHVGTHD